MRQLSLFILTCVVLTLVPGCHLFWRSPWPPVTRYTFEGLPSNGAKVVEDVFDARGVEFTRTGSDPATYDVEGLRTAWEFRTLQVYLYRAIKKNELEVTITSASVDYFGVTARGGIATTVTIRVSPGAQAFIADGTFDDPWTSVRIDRKGFWRGEVRTDGIVSEVGNWIYGAAVLGDSARYFRINVITKLEEPVRERDLPFDPPPGAE
jgi:hypothetical protein